MNIAEQYSDDWLAAYARLWDMAPLEAQTRGETIRRAGGQVGLASITRDGQMVAVGIGVVERGWMGIFGMAVRSDLRRQGLATSVLAELARWGEKHRVSRMYLQVVAANQSAIALYAGLGFSTLYQYHYRTLAA